LPDIFNTPLPDIPAAPLPPVLVQFPVIVNVPVELIRAASPVVPLLQFPTILADDGEADENVSNILLAVVDLFVRFAVKVTPLLRTYVPVPALLNSVQVTFAVMVTVCVVEALASSAAPGTMPPTQVAPALKFPVAAERISAIFYSPFA